MSGCYRKILRNRKRRIARRLGVRNWEEQTEPMFRGSNLHYEMAEKSRGFSYGGVGAFVKLVQKVGLAEEIDERLPLLKRHLPYHESDHVLNVAYNALLGGVRLEDLELRRNDEVYLDALGTQRIPDPTTAGDFTRRFSEATLDTLMECINTARERVWSEQPKGFLKEAVIDADSMSPNRWDDCRDPGRMQGRDRFIVQGHLGLCAVDRIFGEHERAVVSGEPTGEQGEP